eukprot:jgi/Bigna1/138586/aug1.45_g13294
MNPIRMKVSSSNFVPSRQCLHWAGDVVVGVKSVLPIAMMGALSPQKPGMLCEGNVSAKAGDVVAGMKWTMKVWSMGLCSWGSQDLGMRDPEVGKHQAPKTMKLGTEEWPFLIPFGFTKWSSLKAALGPASPACSSLFDAPDSVKTRVLLGAPSVVPNVDLRVDVALRKFLLRMDALRRRRLAAGCDVFNV